MIQKSPLFLSLTLIILMPVSKFLCHPQKIMYTTKDSLMNNTIALQNIVCHGCRKLFSYDPFIKAPEEDYVKPEVTTRLRDTAIVDDVIIQGNIMISNSSSAESLASTQAWSKIDAKISEIFPSPQPSTTIYQTRDLGVRWSNEGISNVAETSEFLKHESSDEQDAWNDKEIKRTNLGIKSDSLFAEDSRSTISASHVSVTEEVLLAERNGENWEETRKSNSETFGRAGGIRSTTGMSAEVSKGSKRMTSKRYSSLDIQQTEVPLIKRNEEDQEETRTADSEKFGDTGSTRSMTWSLPHKGKMKDESQFPKADKRISTDPKNFEVSNSEISLHPKQTNDELEVNYLKSFPYAETLETKHESFSNILEPGSHRTPINQAEWQTSSIMNFGEAHNKSAQSLQYVQPIQIRKESSETINEAPKATEPIENSYQVFGYITTTESSLVPSQYSDKLQENSEIRNSKNAIWTVAGNRNYFDFPQTRQLTIEGPINPRSLNDTWDQRDDKPYFPTAYRGIKSSQEFSKIPDSTTKLPVITNVSDVVLQNTTNRLKSNRTLNLLHSSLAEACEKGSGSCLKCREISPYCHYNFRAKLCFYADVAHGNVIYECGVRFFTADGYQPFWIALTVLILASLLALFFLARAFYKRILQKDPITDMEVNDMHNIVHLIREKRSV